MPATAPRAPLAKAPGLGHMASPPAAALRLLHRQLAPLAIRRLLLLALLALTNHQTHRLPAATLAQIPAMAAFRSQALHQGSSLGSMVFVAMQAVVRRWRHCARGYRVVGSLS